MGLNLENLEKIVALANMFCENSTFNRDSRLVNIRGVLHSIRYYQIINDVDRELIFPQSVLITSVDLVSNCRKEAFLYGMDAKRINQYIGSYIEIYQFEDKFYQDKNGWTGRVLMQYINSFNECLNKSLMIFNK